MYALWKMCTEMHDNLSAVVRLVVTQYGPSVEMILANQNGVSS